MSKVFEDFNIYGIPDSDETCILASLLSGEPSLFIGPPGTAKTEIIYMIGSALRESSKRQHPANPEKWFRFNVYDTSKMNFEDLIGWPNPNALKEGKVSFIESPTTIWDKDMIGLDELNRCAEDRQANLFEIIRNRTCMGSKTNVKFIFSAINPYGDVGTNNLSGAIIDRHLFFLHFAGFDKMDPTQRKKVIERVGSFDSVGIRHWTGATFKFDSDKDYQDGKLVINNTLADQGDRLKDIIKSAAEAYPIICDQLGKSISSLVDTLVSRLSNEKDVKSMPNISGRRAGMIARGIFAYRSVQLGRAKVIGTTPDNIRNTVYNTIMSCLPVGIEKPATEDTMTKVKHIIGEVCSYWEKTIDASDSSNSNLLYDIYYNPDPITKLELLLRHNNINNLVMTKAWKDLTENDLEINSILMHLRKALPDIIPAYVIDKSKEKEIQNFLDNCSQSISMSSFAEAFESDFLALLDPKNHKFNVTYVCAVLAAIRINKLSKSYTDVQLALKVTNHLIQRCNELLESKVNRNETQPSS